MIARWSAKHLVAPIVVLVAGMALTAVVSYAAWVQETDNRAEELAHSGHLVALVLEDTINLGISQLRSAQALFAASDDVSAVEFSRFALHRGYSPGMESVGFARIVQPWEWEAFAQQARIERPQYVVVGIEQRPIDEPPLDRPLVPVWYSHQRHMRPGILGLDLADDVLRRDAINRSIEGNRPSITALAPAADDPDGSYVEIYAPVRGEAGGGNGLAFIWIDIFDALDRGIRDALSSIALDITDVTAGGAQGQISRPDIWADSLDIADRRWEITLARIGPSDAPALMLTVMLTGFTISVLAAWLTAMVAAAGRRRREMAELVAVTRDKDMFLSAAAHELRTPLTSVVGITALLSTEWDGLDTDEIRDLLRVTHREASDMADLIEDLLAAGRLEAGAIRYQSEPVDLEPEIMRVMARVDTSVEVAVDLPEDGQRVFADPLRVRQIMRNLVINGLRYAHSRFLITSERDGNGVLVMISNDGPPIAAELAEVLFEPYQMGRNRTDTRGSIGLGLPVSRRLAQAMGGELSYSYANGWCTFTVRLPVVEAASDNPQPLVLAPASSR